MPKTPIRRRFYARGVTSAASKRAARSGRGCIGSRRTRAWPRRQRASPSRCRRRRTRRRRRRTRFPSRRIRTHGSTSCRHQPTSPPRATTSSRAFSSRFSLQCSCCRRVSVQCCCCGTCSASRPPRSPSCSIRARRASTARCSVRARHWTSDARTDVSSSTGPCRPTTCSARSCAGMSSRGERSTSKDSSGCSART